jgi:CheY-like chemotaxis protein
MMRQCRDAEVLASGKDKVILTVLIVESERGLREKAENFLGVAGYRTFAAAEADEALAVLRDHPEIDLLFTDTRMEGPASGYGLARAAKNLRPASEPA